MIGSHTQGSQNSNHGIGSMRPLLEVLAGQGVNGICAQHLGSRHLLDPFNILPHGSCRKFRFPSSCQQAVQSHFCIFLLPHLSLQIST